MKYNQAKTPIECMMTNSTCYKETYPLSSIRGIVVHSTGVNNPNISRYVQPSENDINYNQLRSIIGVNQFKNDWNHIEYQAGVHAFIGKLKSGEIGTVQVMPWNFRPWGCGGGCNNGWIQFEICEDNLKNEKYFLQVYKEACELSAYLCKLYNINPIGKVNYNGKQVPTILCHQDTYQLGLGSNHADVLHWFPKFGKSMNSFREDVLKLLEQEKENQIPEEEEEEMTQEKFNEMMNNWLETQANINQEPTWSEEARTWAENNKYIVGDDKGRKMYKKPMTREEMIVVLHRIFKAKGLE